MAHFTTITINNDYVATIPNHPNEFIQKIIKACSGIYYQAGQDAFNLGMDEPFVFLQKPRLYSEATVFVYRNGRLQEVNDHASYTRDLKEHSPEVYEELIDILRNNLNNLTTTKVLINSGDDSGEKTLLLDTTQPIVFDTDGFGTRSSGEETEEVIVAKWLKSNKIPTTVAKLKKLKPIKRK